MNLNNYRGRKNLDSLLEEIATKFASEAEKVFANETELHPLHSKLAQLALKPEQMPEAEEKEIRDHVADCRRCSKFVDSLLEDDQGEYDEIFIDEPLETNNDFIPAIPGLADSQSDTPEGPGLQPQVTLKSEAKTRLGPASAEIPPAGSLVLQGLPGGWNSIAKAALVILVFGGITWVAYMSFHSGQKHPDLQGQQQSPGSQPALLPTVEPLPAPEPKKPEPVKVADGGVPTKNKGGKTPKTTRVTSPKPQVAYFVFGSTDEEPVELIQQLGKLVEADVKNEISLTISNTLPEKEEIPFGVQIRANAGQSFVYQLDCPSCDGVEAFSKPFELTDENLRQQAEKIARDLKQFVKQVQTAKAKTGKRKLTPKYP